MKRLIKFLLGLAAGATVAALVTPRSGREMREQLYAGVSSRLLPSAPEPQTLLEEPAGGAGAVAVGEPEAAPDHVSAPAPAVEPWFRPAEEPVIDEASVVEETPPLAAGPWVEQSISAGAGVGVWPEEQETTGSQIEESSWNAGAAAAVEAPLYAEPPLEESVEPPVAAVDDLRPRIEETRTAVESQIAQPFAPAEEPAAESEITQAIAPVEAEPVAEAPVVEEQVEAEPRAPRRGAARGARCGAVRPGGRRSAVR